MAQRQGRGEAQTYRQSVRCRAARLFRAAGASRQRSAREGRLVEKGRILAPVQSPIPLSARSGRLDVKSPVGPACAPARGNLIRVRLLRSASCGYLAGCDSGWFLRTDALEKRRPSYVQMFRRGRYHLRCGCGFAFGRGMRNAGRTCPASKVSLLIVHAPT